MENLVKHRNVSKYYETDCRLKLVLFKIWCHFFFFLTPFFDCGPVFSGDTQPIEKKLLGFQMQNFMLNLLNKKLFENNHRSRSFQEPDN